MKNLTINAGDYARSYDGYIARCKRFYSYDNFIYFDRYIIDTHLDSTNYFEKKDIKKYIKVVSTNIIDLIEVGDMVKVEDFGWVRVSIKFETLKFFDADGTEWLYDEIESIVTKEQMKDMEYKIEK